MYLVRLDVDSSSLQSIRIFRSMQNLIWEKFKKKIKKKIENRIIINNKNFITIRKERKKICVIFFLFDYFFKSKLNNSHIYTQDIDTQQRQEQQQLFVSPWQQQSHI